MMIIIILQGYVAKRTPKMIRGITNAVLGIMANLGSMIFLVLSGVFTKLWGPSGIWASMIALDSLYLFSLVIMILLGKYGTKPNINDGESDRGADEGKGGYEDIPDLGPDGGNIDQANVYNEHILEASSRNEQSTYHGSVVKSSLIGKSFHENNPTRPTKDNESIQKRSISYSSNS